MSKYNTMSNVMSTMAVHIQCNKCVMCVCAIQWPTSNIMCTMQCPIIVYYYSIINTMIFCVIQCVMCPKYNREIPILCLFYII